MERVIVTGKTIQKALDQGLKELQTERDRVKYNVLEEAQAGFLGFFGRKDAKLEVIKLEDKVNKSEAFLTELIDEMGLNLKVELLEKEKNQEVTFNLIGDDLGIAIGHRGKTLDALQYLTNLAINKGEQDYLRINLDAEGYRTRRNKTLENLALRMAKKAKKTGRKVMLEPMPPHERRIIHTVLQKMPKVETHSEGKDPYRKVVILAK